MKCKIKGCGGDIREGIKIRRGVGLLMYTVHPCGKCGRLHLLSNGRPAFDGGGYAEYLNGPSKDPECPVVNVVPFQRGQEALGFTYYVLLSVGNNMYLSYERRFDVKDIANARLFYSVEEAKSKAQELGFEVEEYTDDE